MTTLRERKKDLGRMFEEFTEREPQTPQRPLNTKRLVFISDLHEQWKRVKIPTCDVLVVSGDLTYRGDYGKLRDFNDWCLDLQEDEKVKEVVVIAGNHDLTAQSDPDTVRNLLEDVTYLCDEAYEWKGLKFYGSPWSPTFGHGWAFNANRGRDIRKYWDLIPAGLDVLITHGPPYGCGDVVDRHKGVINEHVGCWDLREAVLQKAPRIHAFGHIHEGYGTSLLGNTLCVNASTCTYQYKPDNPPLVIDL